MIYVKTDLSYTLAKENVLLLLIFNASICKFSDK